MNNYFTEQEYFNVEKQRKNCFLIYLATAVVFLIISTFIYIAFANEPYGSTRLNLFKAIQFIISGIYVVFSFLYIGIKMSCRSKDKISLSQRYLNPSRDIEKFTGNIIEYHKKASIQPIKLRISK